MLNSCSRFPLFSIMPSIVAWNHMVTVPLWWEMEEYRCILAEETMTDDSMTADSWNPSRTARIYAVREDFIIFTVIVSWCHTISHNSIYFSQWYLFLAVVFYFSQIAQISQIIMHCLLCCVINLRHQRNLRETKTCFYQPRQTSDKQTARER